MKRVIRASKVVRGSRNFYDPDIQDLYNDIDNLISTLESIYGNRDDEEIQHLDEVLGPEFYDNLLFTRNELAEKYE